MKKFDIQNDRYVLTVSYGNYTVSNGGTDKVIFAHQKLLNDNGISVIHICPLLRIGMHYKVRSKELWQVLIDGKFTGYFTTEQLCNSLNSLHNNGKYPCNVFIHHLRDVNISKLTEVVEFLKVPVYFYLHDYMTVCSSAGLINDKQEFCGMDKPSAEKCANCQHRHEKDYIRENEIVAFFDKFIDKLTFIAPSDAAKDVWAHTYADYLDKVKVIYHQKVIGNYEGNNELLSDDEPIKIAFVGYQSPLKGWYIWRKAVEKCHENHLNEKFFQFGRVDEHIDYVDEVKVDFRTYEESMPAKLRANSIHVAVLWSIWPETYSYTYYEASSANTFILTNSISGNMADQVRKNGNGIVADSTDDLVDILMDEKKLRAAINDYRSSMHSCPDSLEENDELLSLISEVGEHNETYNKRAQIKEVIVIRYLESLNNLYLIIKRKK